uniref:MAGUK p55 scaffold protein 2 n=1 Tax=Pelodiscus sinensis TaxID=13735 RepID=K7G2C0_PELSI
AMQQVLDNLSDLPNSTGAADLDLIFLRGIMESPIVRSLAKAHKHPKRVRGWRCACARLYVGSSVRASAYQQGLLHVGDVIKEVNGQEVGNDPKVLQEMLKNATGSVGLKILPSYQEPHPPRQVFVKSHFDYDPASDSLIPCREAGLKFTAGDLLQIVNQDDPNWWQAAPAGGGAGGRRRGRRQEEGPEAGGGAGGRRRGRRQEEGTLAGAGRGRRQGGVCVRVEPESNRLTQSNDPPNLLVPPPRQRTRGVQWGRLLPGSALKSSELCLDRQSRAPNTSRKPKDHEKDGQGYCFVSRGEMEADIKAGRYLEHGEYEGNLYGTKIDSIHEVVESGKMCILDVSPQAVKVLRTAEFVPYVVFIEAPDYETLRAMNKAALESGVATKQLTEADLKRTVDETSRSQ